MAGILDSEETTLAKLAATLGTFIPTRYFTPQLQDVANCPHCSVAHPQLVCEWDSGQPTVRSAPGPVRRWAAYRCVSCGGIVLAKGDTASKGAFSGIEILIPSPKEVHVDIPEPARRFLEQAHNTLHSPDAAGVMAGSAVDAMLKTLGYADGSVYARIDRAVSENKLTLAMGQWAHEVRLGANRPRHSDADDPHLTQEEAENAVEFADALGYFLFVLTKRIERGTLAAKQDAPKDQAQSKSPAHTVSKAPPPISPARGR